MSDTNEEEYSTPKIKGDGDTIKNITVRRRVAVPSARKFNPRAPRDESLKLKLEHAIAGMEKGSQSAQKVHCCLKKSLSVAEITPTKSKSKKRALNVSDKIEETTIYATPRRLENTPKIKHCEREAIVCTVYQRLLLKAWRRSKTQLADLSEVCDHKKHHISQMEMQIDVFKNLRNAECQKRLEALNESQQLTKKLNVLELESADLVTRLRKIGEELDQTKADLKQKEFNLRNCLDQITNLQEQLKKKKRENRDLTTKIANMDAEIFHQASVISHLEEALKTTENNLLNNESNYKIKHEEYNEAMQQLQKEVEENYSLNQQVWSLQEQKLMFENEMKNLENQLDEYVFSFEQLREENETITNSFKEVSFELREEKKKTWLKNTKQLASLSLTALQKIAYVMLPAYLDNPSN